MKLKSGQRWLWSSNSKTKRKYIIEVLDPNSSTVDWKPAKWKNAVLAEDILIVSGKNPNPQNYEFLVDLNDNDSPIQKRKSGTWYYLKNQENFK